VLLTVLSRLGAGSRVVLTHDVAQRDNLRVGRHDGVAAVIESSRPPLSRTSRCGAASVRRSRRCHRDAREISPSALPDRFVCVQSVSALLAHKPPIGRLLSAEATDSRAGPTPEPSSACSRRRGADRRRLTGHVRRASADNVDCSQVQMRGADVRRRPSPSPTVCLQILNDNAKSTFF